MGIRLSKLSLLIYTAFIVTWIIFALLSSKLDQNIQANYLVLLFGYFLVGCLFTFYSMIKGIDIFEPLPVITVIYIMIFSIAPMLDLLTENTYFFGYNVVGGTIKATFIYIGGYIAFFIGYSMKKLRFNWENSPEEITSISKKKKMWINLSLWGFGLLSSLIYLMGFGQSILYILSFGFGGTVQKNLIGGSSLAFLGVFSNAMVVPWMYLIINTRSITLRLLITFLTASIYFVIGFRFIIVIMIIAPIVYYYLKHQKRPSIVKVIIVLIILTILVGLVGYVRGDLRRGNEVTWSEFGMDEVWYGIESNFEIYKAFYKMVEVIPESHSYTMGRQMSYTFTIMIPRFLWPNKPDTPLRKVLQVVLNDYAVAAGTAWPNIGEFYSEFGVVGVVLLMYLFGVLCKASKKLYIGKNVNSHTLIAYSILLPAYLQMVIRGYMPTNFWMLVFFGIPIWINSMISKSASC